MRAATVLSAMVIALAASAGCSKGDGEAAPPQARISEEEKARGREACARYAQRACGCAEQHPDLVEECQLAQARPEALEAALRTLEAGADDKGKLGRNDVSATQAAARRTMSACFEADAKLDPRLCPREAAAAPATGADEAADTPTDSDGDSADTPADSADPPAE